MEHIRQNIQQIRGELDQIAQTLGKHPDEILLVAVTKTRSAEEIDAAIDAGITDIGENKVQEILDKYESVKPVRWHLIGHLQTNKVKYIIDKVALIHSVDSFRLAEEIQRRALQHGIVMEILIQINAAEEESKFGIGLEETMSLIREILTHCPNIRIRGLMTIAPFEEDPEAVRKFFRQVREIYEHVSKTMAHPNLSLSYLSMGMSHDFRVALEEGSNLVRIGTALFGARNYIKQ